MKDKIAVIILAAGLGTRMKSNRAKVLHEIRQKPMVLYVVETAMKVAASDIILVIGNQAEEVRETVSKIADLTFAFQEEQLGTGHAVLCALPFISDSVEEVVILCGDVPLITAETIIDLVDDHQRQKRDVSLLAAELEDPTGYGRIVTDKNNRFCAIVEESDASKTEKRIKIVNSGIFCVNKQFLLKALPKIRSDNAKGEIYLTDLIAIGYSENKNLGIKVGAHPLEIIGVNTAEDLERVEAIMRSRNIA
jgi:UDP-N-acetylglucosamine diphosphorylase/glucosamine-1-phosphate N-acetyltransferase